jgi:Zn-dependent M28 family amino/carboxypeptidase
MQRFPFHPALAVVASLLAAPAGSAKAEAPPPDPAERILEAAIASNGAWEKLAHLCDRIGHRLSGSAALEKAVAWTAATMERDGADRVWTEPVKVPLWVRGEETGRIVAPVEHEMAVMALGMSEPTPPGGITAEVVAVDSFDALEALPDEAVRGKIVLYNRPMRRNGGPEYGYGSAAGLRYRGAAAAAKKGAVGMLIRSVGTADYRLPHTGAMAYEDGVPRIPAAAIAVEDALQIERLLASGEKVKVSFTLGCRNAGEADSANVIAEIRGREKPEEIVLIGAHLDSWDAGCGAHDDGAGVVHVMEALRVIRSLGLAPRRTIRVVLFTNEENGLRGGTAYAQTHAADLDRHVAAIETDSGGFRPKGFGVSSGPGGIDLVRRISVTLDRIEADEVTEGGGGADISAMRAYGVPQMGLRTDTDLYFDYHHTDADTLDKVDPHELRLGVAAMAVMAWGLADAATTLPRLPSEPPEPLFKR